MKMDQLNAKSAELSIDELDNVSGGFLWIAAVVGGFAVGTGIRMGIDWAVKRLF